MRSMYGAEHGEPSGGRQYPLDCVELFLRRIRFLVAVQSPPLLKEAIQTLVDATPRSFSYGRYVRAR